MGFKPISIEGYVRLHVKANRGENPAEITAALQGALKRYRKGARCGTCGDLIWVIGSAVVGDTWLDRFALGAAMGNSQRLMTS